MATDWRMLPAAVAATSNMPRDEALAILRKHACARDAILLAVYEYWRAKRERWGKPIMRRLQAPTNPSDTNPYNVFRPRERVNRPQTRRRRENTHDCLDKMRQIRESMLRRLDVDMQRYQLARHHQPRPQQEAAEAEAATQLREVQARSKQGESRLRAYLESGGQLSASMSYDISLRRALMRKRRRQEMEGCANGEAVGRLPPPPLQADDEMLMLFSPDFTKLLGKQAAATAAANGSSSPASSKPASPAAAGPPPILAVPAGLDLSCTRARIGRCGRPMLTRCDPFTMEFHSPLLSADGTSEAGPLGEGPTMPAPSPLALRHPLLHSSQQPSVPWAATLDLEWLPEGIADKAMLRAQRERRLNADRLNAAVLRQTQQSLQQQAAGGIVGASSMAGAAAAAAAASAPAAPGTGAAGAGAVPGGVGATPGSAAGVKKMLPTSKAVAGPSSASQLKRGPGRPPKAAKATPNGDALPPPPSSSTTVPMDML
ncbi:hypothetical protein GPECTOR_70g475 [Gonium pectorale]|uniref:Enhancer of polycomb-like protein n=1 Tax=Gonium pectorale TaxID=33097 RepID=A0A150G401_GONPE|nr:hypothetical protein GPECTOR_70g475 [Gonium pectorale]|eukprot:KXZ44245.1 hypothetical protein GPECTOR_70g475 [Gonium pectorale]